MSAKSVEKVSTNKMKSNKHKTDSVIAVSPAKYAEITKKGVFTSEKVFDGYSACFRQWRAEGTHCKFLHGYGISFKVVFEGDLDEKNWVFDFGGMKRAKTKINGLSPNEYFTYLLDHTTIIAKDDPELQLFMELDSKKVIQLRIMDNVGCEIFAKHLFDVINTFLKEETKGRVKATSVTVNEHSKNSATYSKK